MLQNSMNYLFFKKGTAELFDCKNQTNGCINCIANWTAIRANKSVLTTEFSFLANMLTLISIIWFKQVCVWVVKFAQWAKKWAVDSIWFPQLHKGPKNLENLGYLC